MLRKLRVKFVLITMVVVTVMLCSIFAMMYHATKTDLENKSINTLERIASKPFPIGRPEEFGQFDQNVPLPYFALELGMHGEIFATYGGYFDLSDTDYFENVIAEAFESDRQMGILHHYNLRFKKVMAPGRQYLVCVDTSHEQGTLQNLLLSSLLIGLVSWAALFVGSIFLARWAVRPVEKAWAQQKQFVSDASHELKTPLTAIMTNAQMLQNADNTEEDKAFLSGNILTMSEQMRKLLEQMLELARSDNMQTQPVFSPVNLSALAEDTALVFEPVFFDREMVLESHIQPGIVVDGSEAQLREVLEIFLDNAQKYATSGGHATVTLDKHGRNKCVLTVANEGAPIPAEHLENLFKRFYRADQARTRNGSFGLGLSIAKSIVEHHKGKIWAESLNGVNSFSVELSLAS